MANNTTFIYTTGTPGSGKSYYRCARYLLDDYLPNTDCVHCSNFPIEFDEWRDQNGKQRDGLVKLAKRRGIEEDVLRDRVITFDPEDVETWRNVGLAKGEEPYGPWDQLDEKDISGWHIAIDEIHNFCGRHSSTKVQQAWETWLGEIRHQGATVEFLTQADSKVARCIRDHSEVRYNLVKGETLPDFWFKIPMYDWYQLRAKLCGSWYSCCYQISKRQEDSKWKKIDQQKFTFDAEYFGAYNSHSTPVAGARAGGERPMEWQTMNWRRLLLWFIFRNDSKLLIKGALLMLPFILIFAGPWLVPKFFHYVPEYFTSQMTDDQVPEISAGSTEPSITEIHRAAVIRDQQFQAQPQALADLAGDDEGFTLGVVSRDQVVFRNGFSFRVGETIDVGPHKGRAVDSIDFTRRMVHLDDGEILRLGAAPRRLPVGPGAPGYTTADLHRHVPAAVGPGTRRE